MKRQNRLIMQKWMRKLSYVVSHDTKIRTPIAPFVGFEEPSVWVRFPSPARFSGNARPPGLSKRSETCVRLSGDSSGLIRTEKFQVSGDSAAVPKLSAKCCAANVAHSSQMKTLLLS